MLPRGLADAELFAGFQLRFGGKTVELAELANGYAVARCYTAERVAALDGVGLCTFRFG